MGDIYRLLGTNVQIIALIDGVFHSEQSVWHRELLEAVDAGIRVIGASSMGALRAVELNGLGVEGHGTVFDWYRDGVVERDDEVALQHGDADSGYCPLSEPLVNVRATMSEIVGSGLITTADAQGLLDYATRLYYPQRSLPALLDSPTCRNWSAARRRQLLGQLRARRRDIKRDDAISLLSHLAVAPQCLESRAPTAIGSPIYRRVALSFRSIGGVSGAILLSQLDDRPACLAERRRAVIASWLLAAWAREMGVSCPEKVVAVHRERWRNRHEIGDVSMWLCRQGMIFSEFEDGIYREALCAWLCEVGSEHFGVGSYVADWASRRGLAPPKKTGLELWEWLADHEPSAFGYRCDVSVELLQYLQLTDRLSLLVDS